ncbi:ABC transporter permease [Sporolactobacillus sp. STSJ-5]|uniref:YhgE/Pip domain-containing protein n=1 Tax=Sporolactobacillus sp. STSJ-5 TaxID=2965076 RepID=UPI002104D581|nr:ABC transporter permease [Sporolactobacillus sp. STSJ-5]MCQ2010242.1 ABC transporter permease [Sporolactobacillus sp. STSJ-5]
MNVVRDFFKIKETKIGLAAGLLFLICFFGVWMTVYQNIDDRSDQLHVALVNQDLKMSQKEVVTLKNKIPFKVHVYQSLNHAKSVMNKHKVDMIMVVPNNFTKQISSNKRAELHYYINQANSSLAKQIMNQASDKITQSMNQKMYALKQQVVNEKATAAIKQGLPQPQAAQQVTTVFDKAIQSLNLNTVTSKVTKSNNVKGFPASVLPLCIVLVSYVGSMVMQMNIYAAVTKLRKKYNKWRVYLAHVGINLAAAVVLAALVMLALQIFDFNLHVNGFGVFLFQILSYFSFMNLSQMFLYVLGFAGNAINVLGTPMQLMTSGAIIPKAVLAPFYYKISFLYPAAYVANAYYLFVYGGTGLGHDVQALFVNVVVTLVVSVLAVTVQRNRVENIDRKKRILELAE